jgi:hypothetical protein
MALNDYRIIYKTIEGTVAVISPASNISLTIQEIASKDVPTGRPYKIVAASDIPTDRTFRNAWDIPDAELTDGVGGSEGNGEDSAYLIPNREGRTEEDIAAEVDELLFGRVPD